MRQLWYAGFALVAGLSLAACDNSPKKQETKQEPPKTETTKTAAAPTATPPAAPAPVAAKPAAPAAPAPAPAPAATPPAAPAPVAAKPAAPAAPAPAAAPAAEAAKVAAVPAPAAAPAAPAKVVKIAIGGPLTGANAAFGAQIKNGSEQAAEDINAAGGILGHKIELLYGDDVSDPKQGVSIANKFAGDGAKLVVGHFNSGVSIPASDVYAENGMLQITPASTNPTFTERGMWNVFRTCGRDDQQGTVAGNYIAEVLKGKKVAVVHDKTTYGKGLADETKKAMNAKGVTEVLYEGVNTGEKDFSALISKIKESGAEIVYWGGLHTEGGLIVRQMRDAAVTATLMGADGIATDEFAAVAGPGAEGTLMTFAPDPQKRPEAAAVLAKFEARKFKPESYTLYSYAAMQILKTAAERAGKIDPKTMAAVMHSGEPFKTVIGDIGYDKKGDITRLDYVMYTWKKQADGRITFVQNP